MCGIVGYVGPKVVTPLLIEGLKRLEYRGYDSAGVAVMNGKGVETRKVAGKISRLEAAVNDESRSTARWASRTPAGPPTARPTRSTPIRSSTSRREIAVVHNGIIENASALRRMLEEHGHVFTSETDTEVLVHLIEAAFDDDRSRMR